MACYHPIKFIKIENYLGTGKTKMKFCPDENLTGPNIVEVPCGQCIGCRLDYSRQWADRCMLEAKQYKNNYMITLTYDNDNLPTNERINYITGEKEKVGTLQPHDLTKFMKDLRNYYKYHFKKDNIRFYACGEYGEQTERPHYHVILFNIEINDLKPFFKNELGQQTYLSKTIEDIWEKGQINVCEVTWNTCAYVARYVTKKQKGKEAKEYYKNKCITPEFVRMSRKPGIGRQYYEKHKKDIYKYDSILYKNYLGQPHSAKPPKYFDRIMEEENPKKLEEVKNIRKMIAENNNENELKETTLKKFEYNNLKEINKIKEIARLKRNKQS